MGAESPRAPAGGQRLHPLSPVFQIGRSFLSFVVPGLVVLLLAAGDSYEVWYMLAFVPATAAALKRYITLRYRLTAEHLVVREGVFFKKTRHIPYARIQNIDTVQNPLHRLFRVAEVRLETASGQEPEAVLRVLSLAQLEEIRAGVFGLRQRAESRPSAPTARVPTLHEPEQPAGESPGPGAAGSQEPRAPAPFLRLQTADLVWFGLLSQRGLAYLSGLIYLIWEFDLGDRIKGALSVDPEQALESLTPLLGLSLAAAILVLLQALTVVWSFVTLHDFKIERIRDDLRTSCGLWTRQTATLPRHRIQFLQVREGWIQRRLGRLSVRALTAGADASESSPVSRRYLVPLVERGALAGILSEVQPQMHLEEARWRPVHPRAKRRLFKRGALMSLIPVPALYFQLGPWTLLVLAVLLCAAHLHADRRARRLAYALTESGILLRDGVLAHVRNAVLFSRIQSVSLYQSPFDRRHRMASVRVDTAGRADNALSLNVPYLPLREARRLEQRLRHAAAATRFRW